MVHKPWRSQLVIDDIECMPPREVIECGAGTSTTWLRALGARLGFEVTSLEIHPDFYNSLWMSTGSMASAHRANSKLSCSGFLVYTMQASLAICLASSLGGVPGLRGNCHPSKTLLHFVPHMICHKAILMHLLVSSFWRGLCLPNVLIQRLVGSLDIASRMAVATSGMTSIFPRWAGLSISCSWIGR